MVDSAYIHIPFCKNICKYCDFSKMYYNDEIIFKYLISLENEINNNYKKESLKSLYIGGGTPSSLNKKHLKKLFNIISIFNFNDSYEFTFECNIEDINEELLEFLKNNKVNRLSIGVQSFNKKTLDILGRNYCNDCFDKIILCKKYFTNINIDLMYGINGCSINDLKDDLDKYLKLDIPHISIYSLILEDNTMLKVNNYVELDDDITRKMYDLITKTLKNNGYIHYEISNFSKEGYNSIHNLTYWNNDKYYGFGLGASGYINNIRYTNTRSINKYLDNDYLYDKEIIDKKLDMSYFMILGLRKIKGVSELDFYKRYNTKISDVFNIDNLSYKDGYYYIDEDKLFIENSILVDFV